MNLETFNLKDMVQLGSEVRELAPDLTGLEAVATLLTRHLFDRLSQGSRKDCVFVRIFRTQRFRDLDPSLQRLVTQRVAYPSEDLNCIVMLGTAGVEAEFDSTAAAGRYRLIPLPDQAALAEMPTLTRLFESMGITGEQLVRPLPELFHRLQDESPGTFYVAEATGNAAVPLQQEIVLPYKVRSVLGFGGLLGQRELFACVLFSRVPIRPEVAELFRPLALSVRMRLERSLGQEATRDYHSELLSVYERSISEQFDRLHREVRQRERQHQPILRRRAEHLAERQLGEPRRHRVPDHLVARAGALQLAVSTTHLLGVASPPVTPVPLAPAELLGLTTFQDKIWPVIQLRPETGSTSWLLFWKEPALALRVDSLVGLGWVESERLSAPPPVLVPRSLRLAGLTADNWLVLEPNQ